MNWPWKRIVAGVVVFVVAALYFSGSLDDLLYKVGLNFHKCGENGFGAVFCGSSLTQYENRINAAEKAVQQAEQSLTTTTTSSTASSVAYVPASAVGSVSAKLLPDSSEAEATFTVAYTCGSTETSCVWYGEASQYPYGTKCPTVFDASRAMWTGSVEQGSGTETQSVAYLPDPGRDKACIYVHDVAIGPSCELSRWRRYDDEHA
jgi:hypothetical protein